MNCQIFIREFLQVQEVICSKFNVVDRFKVSFSVKREKVDDVIIVFDDVC